jgi:hypothetical protein
MGGEGDNPGNGGSFTAGNSMTAHLPEPDRFQFSLVADGGPRSNYRCKREVFIQIKRKTYDVETDIADKNGFPVSSMKNAKGNPDWQLDMRESVKPLKKSEFYVDAEKKTYRYVNTYKCDQTVSFTPRLQNNNQKAVRHFDWDAKPPYKRELVMLDQDGSKTHTLRMTENKRIRYLLETGFMLQSITLDTYTEDRSEERTFNITSAGELLMSENELAKLKIRLSHYRGPQFRNTVSATLRFNGNVEASSLTNGNLKFKDLNGRIDSVGMQDYLFGSSDYCSGKTVFLPLISNTGLSIMNSMKFSMDVGSNVKGRIDATAELTPLANPTLGVVSFKTQYPHIQVRLEEIKLTECMDGVEGWFTSDADVHFTSTVAVSKRNTPYVNVISHGEYELDKNDSRELSADIGNFVPESDNDVLFVGFRAVDKDKGVDLSRFLDSTRTDLFNLLSADSTANEYILAAKLAYAVAKNWKLQESEDIMGDTEYRIHRWAFDSGFWRGVKLTEGQPWDKRTNEVRAGTYRMRYKIILNAD